VILKDWRGKATGFRPDYRNIVDAARNVKAVRLPLYEHIIAPEIMEMILNHEFAGLPGGNEADVLNRCSGHGGFAFGSGNSIPTYVPVDNYMDMIGIVRSWREERV